MHIHARKNAGLYVYKHDMCALRFSQSRIPQIVIWFKIKKLSEVAPFVINWKLRSLFISCQICMNSRKLWNNGVIPQSDFSPLGKVIGCQKDTRHCRQSARYIAFFLAENIFAQIALPQHVSIDRPSRKTRHNEKNNTIFTNLFYVQNMTSLQTVYLIGVEQTTSCVPYDV